MKLWQGISVMALVGLAGCGQQTQVRSNVIVQRGEAVMRVAAAPEQPFIQELPQPPAVAKPVEPLIAKVEPNEPAQKPEAGKPAPTPAELVQSENAMIGDYSLISFDKLASFAYEVPDDPITDPKAKAIIEKNIIPKVVTDFHKKKIALKGYMLPLKVEGGKITEMLIMRDQSMCCYGTVPKINEWVSVRMPEGKGVKPIMDVPITIFGTLKVGEVLENGYLVGIYELDGDRLGGPIDL
ncbi:MAG: DUF3299 domain-containing protein [Verrucomicrobia subdivision 3 bacterium]|nr:DUF3299 domain-containing protein [Limisphaerales bacterium]